MPALAAPRRARRARRFLTLALVTAVAAFALYFQFAPPGTAFGTWNADPEIVYLLDSLAPFKGEPYRFSEHPGTPLSALGTALLGLLYPLIAARPGGFVLTLVRDPRPFFVLAHALLVAANLACILYLSRRAFPVRRAPDALLAVAVPASFFAFLPESFFWTVYWSHNAVAFPAGSALLMALALALRRGRPLPGRTIAGLGLGTGLLTASQLYFVTWVLGLAVAATASARSVSRRTWSLRPPLLALASAVAGFLLGTLPLAGEYRRLLGFARSLLTHQGSYGAGQPGFTSPRVWLANVGGLWREAPALFAATAIAFLLLAALLVVTGRGRRHRGRRAFALGLCVQWLAILVLLGKHPSRFYLPALAAMLPLILALTFALARRLGRVPRIACIAFALAVAAGCARAAVSAVLDHASRLAFRSAMEQEVRCRLRSLAVGRTAPGESPLLLWAPILPDTPCYSLRGANPHLDHAFRAEVEAVCPGEGVAWSHILILPDGLKKAEGVTALLVASEDTRVLFPAFAALGEPTLSSVARPDGRRLAFYRVRVRDDWIVRAEP
jgi:hypothetical protein